MAADQEIDSFVTKLKHLLYSGYDATLNIETQDGKAFVTLKAGLGHIKSLHYGYPNRQQSKVSRSPSYFRRQERRREAKRNVVSSVSTKSDENVVLVKVDATEENLIECAVEAQDGVCPN